MKAVTISKIVIVIIVFIILYFLYDKKIKTDQPPVTLPYPDKPGGSGGGGTPNPLPVNPPVNPPAYPPRRINTELNLPIIPFKL